MDFEEAEHIAKGHCRAGYYSVVGTWLQFGGVFTSVEDGQAMPGSTGVTVGRHNPEQKELFGSIEDRRKFISKDKAMAFCIERNLAIASGMAQ